MKKTLSKALKILMILGGLLMVAYLSSCKEKKVIDVDKEVVRFEINGHAFNVPLRYMYGETLEKWGAWAHPKKERVKVDVLHIDMLLPDLRPYYEADDAKWKALGVGDKLYLLFQKENGGVGWYQPVLKRYLDEVAEGRFDAKKESDIYGLMHLSNSSWNHYFSPEGGGIKIGCLKPETPSSPTPSCKAKSNYKYGIVLDYSYDASYLPKWKEIDDDLKKLFDKFEQAAIAESAK